jgi:hypothetical protein
MAPISLPMADGVVTPGTARLGASGRIALGTGREKIASGMRLSMPLRQKKHRFKPQANARYAWGATAVESRWCTRVAAV